MDGTSRPSSPSRPTFVTPPAIWEPARDVVDPRDLADVKERADVERPSCCLGEGVAGIEGCSRPSSRSDAEAEGESALLAEIGVEVSPSRAVLPTGSAIAQRPLSAQQLEAQFYADLAAELRDVDF